MDFIPILILSCFICCFSETDSCFSSTGEASNVDEYLWLMGRACYKPIIEYCGGTEIGGGFVSGSFLQPQSLAAFSTPAMGCRLFILGDDGHPIVSTNPTLMQFIVTLYLSGMLVLAIILCVSFQPFLSFQILYLLRNYTCLITVHSEIVTIAILLQLLIMF